MITLLIRAVTFVFLLLPLARVAAQSNLLPAWPLAVKSPFFDSWYSGGERAVPLPNAWPVNWSAHETGWYFAIIVDGVAFRLMGATDDPPIEAAQQLSVDLTATRTIFAMQAGPILVNLTFFSPVTPTDLTRQTIPFSYLYTTVTSTDSVSHSVKIYSDILADWISGNDSLPVTAAASIENDIIMLSTQLQTPIPFASLGGRANDATAYYAIKTTNASNITYQVDSDLRSFAINSTGLMNSVQSPALNTTTNEIGLYVDIGNVSTEATTTVWTIGVFRDPVVRIGTLSGAIQERSSYFMANFSTPQDAVSFFLDDFDNAVRAADQFDAKITSDAEAISPMYRDLVLPVVRQVMGTIEITISNNSDGSWNTTDVLAFVEDLGLLGANGASPVDIMYAAFPAYLYLSPALGGYLLKPIFQLQDTQLYTQPYAAQNLGLGYPNISVHNYQHNFGIEDSANMICMALAHFQASEDSAIISQHYSLLKHWTDYLVSAALNPGKQMTSPSDFITLTNQTNLSLKGIIGIAAMAKISDHLGNTGDSSTYQTVANSYIQQWQALATSPGNDRLLSAFDDSDSGGLIYNLYADKLLQLNLVPDTIHQMQTSFYKTQFSSSSNSFGMPLDVNNPNVTRADWIVFSAAAVVDNTTRGDMITAVHKYVTSGVNNRPLGPLFDPMTGIVDGGSSSPAMGAMFAILALQNVSKGPAPRTSSNFTTKNSTNTTVVVAAVVGGLAGASLASACVYVVRRRWGQRNGRRRQRVTLSMRDNPTRPLRTSSIPYAGIEPHSEIAFYKFPETTIFRNQKSREVLDIPPNMPGPIIPRNPLSESSSSNFTTASWSNTTSLGSTVTHLPDGPSTGETVRSAQVAAVTAISRLLNVLAVDRGEGGSAEAPPIYEERESPLGGSQRR